MGAKGTKNLTEKEFDQIKGLFGYGLKNKQVAEVTKRSLGTVVVTKRFETFEAYKDYNRSRLQRVKTPPVSEAPLISHEDIRLLLGKLDEVKQSVDLLVEDLEKRQAHEKVNNWKFGRSRA